MGLFDGLPAVLVALRERRGLSKAELARRVGMNAVQLRRYETGAEMPSLRSLATYLEGLEVTLYDVARELDLEAGRAPLVATGRARPEWVAPFVRRGIDPDVVWGFALGALERGDGAGEADLVASVEAAARQIVEGALAEAHRIVEEK